MIRDEGALHTHFVPSRWPGLHNTIELLCTYFSTIELSSIILCYLNHYNYITYFCTHFKIWSPISVYLRCMTTTNNNVFTGVNHLIPSIQGTMAPMLNWNEKHCERNRLFYDLGATWNIGIYLTSLEKMNKWFMETLIWLTMPQFREIQQDQYISFDWGCRVSCFRYL